MTEGPKGAQQVEAVVQVALEQVQETWLSGLRQLQGKPPSVVYHYTDAGGLQGIVESQKLWASNALYLNDSTELAYTLNLLRSVLESRIDATDHPAVRDFVEGGVRALSDPEYDPFKYVDMYVACFCEKGDLLSQWRAYAGAIGGYSLGMETDLLVGSGQGQLNFRKVIYCEEDQRSLVEGVVQGFSNLLIELTERFSEERAKEEGPHLFRSLLMRLIEGYLAFKHPAFAEEEEWRLTYLRNRPHASDSGPLAVRFRASSTTLVPFVELPITAQSEDFDSIIPIRQVIIGPNPHPRLAQGAIWDLLHSHGYFPATTKVLWSETPLRA